MQQDNFLGNRQEPPMADKLAARIIYETAHMPQQKSWIEQLKDLITMRPAQVAFAMLCLVALSVIILSNSSETSAPMQVASMQNEDVYEDFVTLYEQETLTFLVADLN